MILVAPEKGPLVFCTDATIASDLADALKMAGPSGLASWQLNLVARLHVAAYNEIVARLAGRGYTLAQITAWDQGADYERSIALHLVLEAGASTESVDDKLIKALDWRPKLCHVVLVSGGVFQAPAGTAGLVGSGAFSTSTDVFVYPPADGRSPQPPGSFGETTHW